LANKIISRDGYGYVAGVLSPIAQPVVNFAQPGIHHITELVVSLIIPGASVITPGNNHWGRVIAISKILQRDDSSFSFQLSDTPASNVDLQNCQFLYDVSFPVLNGPHRMHFDNFFFSGQMCFVVSQLWDTTTGAIQGLPFGITVLGNDALDDPSDIGQKFDLSGERGKRRNR
jgi:hypothetical protein